MATDTRDMAMDIQGMGITRAATPAITAVIHLTERLTTRGGRTTTAVIASTSIVSTITTANNKAYRLV